MRSKINSKKKTMILVILLLCLGLGVGFAYLSQALKINTSANIAKTSWDVHFANPVVSEGSVGDGEVVPALDETNTTATVTIDLANPGEFYEYTLEVKNEGALNAMVSPTEPEEPVLTADQQKYLEYTVTYEDGAEINQYDQLAIGGTEKIKVMIRFKEDVTEEDLPTEATSVTFETTITYVQADSNAQERETNTTEEP